ncbi:hypothetical protein MWU58_10850 [Flavobacteriaceae bacterium S0825]|uniref:hypothetical protein n=1 Tax=Gaetbulibacter sp. S0825 TaxID=2720084 RepID=UPI001AD8113C|nr:hypothetical protein [Gaetbulibacter sp. S0825]MCK0109796.1 hypothetical protein [Flavobacteriaceae bacterium S0825]
MRFIIFASLIFLQICSLSGQDSLKEINLNKGKYEVGFQHYTVIDSTRTYQIHNEHNNQFILRPISISIWYPAEIKNSNTVILSN